MNWAAQENFPGALLKLCHLAKKKKKIQGSSDVWRQKRTNSYRDELNIAFLVLEGCCNHIISFIRTGSIITFSILFSGGKLDEGLKECNFNSLYILFWNAALKARICSILIYFVPSWESTNRLNSFYQLCIGLM